MNITSHDEDLKIPAWENVKLKNSNPVGKYFKIGFLPNAAGKDLFVA